MHVAVHNPSSLNLNTLEIAVPNEMNFNVSYWNTTMRSLVPAYADKVCYADHLDDGNQVTNCKLQVDAWTPAQGVALLELVRDDANGETSQAKRQVIPEGQENDTETTIEGQGLRLVYKGMKKTESTLMFDVYDIVSGSSDPERFEFSMKYWESYSHSLDVGNYMNSGAYVFHPMEGQLHPFPYGDVKEVGITKGGNAQEMDISFGKFMYNEKNESQMSTVHISIDKDLPIIKIDVDLDSLPLNRLFNGYEVVPNFHVANFDQEQTFYTDSNGLEMQKRVQDYRPTWTL